MTHTDIALLSSGMAKQSDVVTPIVRGVAKKMAPKAIPALKQTFGQAFKGVNEALKSRTAFKPLVKSLGGDKTTKAVRAATGNKYLSTAELNPGVQAAKSGLNNANDVLRGYKATNPLAYGTAKTMQLGKRAIKPVAMTSLIGVPSGVAGYTGGMAEGYGAGHTAGAKQVTDKFAGMSPWEQIKMGLGSIGNPNLIPDEIKRKAGGTYTDARQNKGLKGMLELYSTKRLNDAYQGKAPNKILDAGKGFISNLPGANFISKSLGQGELTQSPGQAYRRQAGRDFMVEGVTASLGKMMKSLKPATAAAMQKLIADNQGDAQNMLLIQDTLGQGVNQGGAGAEEAAQELLALAQNQTQGKQ